VHFIGPFSRFVTRRSAAACIVFAALSAQPAIAQTSIVANAQGDIVLPTATAPRAGKWAVASDATAAAGKMIRHPDEGVAKGTTAAASPANYFDMLFEAEAGKSYRLWVHGRADGNYWGNDSVFVQFSRSVDGSGAAVYRIGSTSATQVNIEDCSGCGLSGWMWQDNGFGSNVLGPVIRFATSGTQQIRVQTREDGLAIDQIVLSPATYLTSQPAGTLGVAGATIGEVVLAAGSAPKKAGKWLSATDANAIGGSLIRHADAAASKISTALAAPADYFEMTFQSVAGTPYRLWMRGRADGDSYANDSVHVQFSGSVTSAGASTYRIGTTSSAEVNLEECYGCGLSGWTWQDDGYGTNVLGPTIYFATTGTQTIRVQTREDGMAIDQILLSPAQYLTAEPTTAGAPAPEPAPAPPPPTTSSTLKVFDWNIHHGVGTDGVYNIDRIATAIAKASPDVVSLNEVERYTGWGNEDQPARFAALLKSKTGKTWYYNFATRMGTEKGQGNLLLSVYPIDVNADYLLSYDRSVAHLQIIVNGRRVSLFSTHLDDDSTAQRLTQMGELNGWSDNFPQSTILAGDFNAWPGATEISTMTALFLDTWAVAKAAGTSIAYAGNEAGNTRNSRIDYVWLSKGTSALTIKSSQVFDLRDSSGVMPSDHRPVMTTFEVR